MLRTSIRALGAFAAAAVLIPGTVAAKPGHGHGNPHIDTQAPTLADAPTGDVPTVDAPAVAPALHGHGKHLANGRGKPRNVVVKGTVVSVGGAPETTTDGAGAEPAATAASDAPAEATTVTIHVLHANHHGRALVGQDVTFTIPAGRVRAADANGDGKVDLADVKVGDKVLVQARVAAGAAQPFAARKLVDQTGKKSEDADDDDADEAPQAPAPVPPAV